MPDRCFTDSNTERARGSGARHLVSITLRAATLEKSTRSRAAEVFCDSEILTMLFPSSKAIRSLLLGLLKRSQPRHLGMTYLHLKA
eukprot:4531893-Amphidinium_carterae.1